MAASVLNIWLIQIGEPIPIGGFDRKGRLGHLCDSLAKRGHQITRWGSAFNHITKEMICDRDTDIQIAPNYCLKLVRGLGYKRNVSMRRWVDHLVIEKKISSMANDLDLPDAILVAIPPHSLAYRVVKFANRMHVPVIVDIRDQWPDIFVERLPKVLRRFGKYIFAYEYFKLRRALSDADSVTAMMEELLLWGVESGRRKKTKEDKVFYIGSHVAEKINLQNLQPHIRDVIMELSGRVVFAFIGTFNSFYNPSIIVDVAKLLVKEGRDDIVFVLAGDGGCFEEVRRKAEGLRNVKMTGWLDQQELMALLGNSDVGICPLNDYRPAFPNKVFNYLSAFLPVISSTPGEFERLMKRYGLGLYYKVGDVRGLYDAVVALSKKELRMEMKDNVEEQFREKFEAGRIYSNFADHVESIARRATTHYKK